MLIVPCCKCFEPTVRVFCLDDYKVNAVSRVVTGENFRGNSLHAKQKKNSGKFKKRHYRMNH